MRLDEVKESGFDESFENFVCATGEGDGSEMVELCVIFVWFRNGDDVRVKPCGWVSVFRIDCVQSVKKSLLCRRAEVFEEVVVDVIWARAGGSGALNS